MTSALPDTRPESDLGWQFVTVTRALMERAWPIFADMSQGPRGYRVLRIAAEGDVNQVEIARRLGIDKSVMVGILDDLERCGLVRRETDPTDRRSRRIVVTDEGRARAAHVREQLAVFEADALSPLDPAAQDALRSGLAMMAAYLAPNSLPCAATELPCLD